jgi:hypothetical protein
MIDNLGVLKLECVRTLHVEWAKEVKGGGLSKTIQLRPFSQMEEVRHLV